MGDDKFAELNFWSPQPRSLLMGWQKDDRSWLLWRYLRRCCRSQQSRTGHRQRFSARRRSSPCVLMAGKRRKDDQTPDPRRYAERGKSNQQRWYGESSSSTRFKKVISKSPTGHWYQSTDG